MDDFVIHCIQYLGLRAPDVTPEILKLIEIARKNYGDHSSLVVGFVKRSLQLTKP